MIFLPQTPHKIKSLEIKSLSANYTPLSTKGYYLKKLYFIQRLLKCATNATPWGLKNNRQMTRLKGGLCWHDVKPCATRLKYVQTHWWPKSPQ